MPSPEAQDTEASTEAQNAGSQVTVTVKFLFVRVSVSSRNRSQNHKHFFIVVFVALQGMCQSLASETIVPTTPQGVKKWTNGEVVGLWRCHKCCLENWEINC